MFGWMEMLGRSKEIIFMKTSYSFMSNLLFNCGLFSGSGSALLGNGLHFWHYWL